MNGRIYDPLLGRFLSADLVVQAPGNLQSFNRYSYVMNNPLSLTDPSGFNWFSDAASSAREFGVAVFGGIAEGNDFTGGTTRTLDSLNASKAGEAGRITGNLLTMAQGFGEHLLGDAMGATGAAMVVAGTAEAVAAAPTGVGSVPGVAVAAGGVVVGTTGGAISIHGAAVGLHGGFRALQNIARLSKSDVKTGSDKGKIDTTAKPNEQPRDSKGRWQSPGEGDAQPGKPGEQAIHDKLGTTQNTKPVSGTEGKSIPDINTSTTIGDIKDTAVVNDSSQLRIQREAAADSGRVHEVHTGTNTQVSSTVLEQSKVIRHPEIGPQE